MLSCTTELFDDVSKNGKITSVYCLTTASGEGPRKM